MQILKLIASSCGGGSFFGLPKWYAYLPTSINPATHQCSPRLASISDIWLIVAAIVDLLLRIAALGSVIMIIVGGVMFTTSQGSPEHAAKARTTIIYSLIGLLISVSAAFLITFIAQSIGA